MSMNWNEFAAEVHQLAVEKGWWETTPSFAQITVMCHSELSEAVEEYRAGRPMVWHACMIAGGEPCSCDCGKPCRRTTREFPCDYRDPKPEGVAVEMGDCILRILDVLADLGGDIDGKIGVDYTNKKLIETVAKCHSYISKAFYWQYAGGISKHLMACVNTILDWAAMNDVDMEAVLRAKHEYNKTQPRRHGGKAL